MKAAFIEQHGGPEVVQIGEQPTPEPAPGQVLLKVAACGVNWLDILVREAHTPAKISFPRIMGSEVAGTVTTLGLGVTHIAVGARMAVHPYLHCGTCEFCLAGEESVCVRGDILGLMSNGGYAEYVCVPANSLVPIPEAVSFMDAAAVTLATLTAWHMLIKRARLQPGERVLVLGASSGVGSAAIQIAKLAGATVIATAGSDAKLELARKLGADEVVNHTEGDIRDAVRTWTGRRGVDVVVEHVGEATFQTSVAALARNGRLVICGTTTGSNGPLNLWTLFAKQNEIIGSYGGTRAELGRVLELVGEGRLHPVIDSVVPLDQVVSAQQRLLAREQLGKIIVDVHAA
ncbi:MAG: zinc-binding dehydrogenase [Chloroflexota bacterium]